MSSHFKGRCMCGQISYSATGDTAIAAYCHCTDCQKSTGSGHATLAGFADAQVSIEGTPKAYQKQADSGRSVTRFFCPDCGCPLYSEVEAMPGLKFFKMGAFDETGAYEPSASFYAKSAKAWDKPAEGLPAFDEMPG